MGQRRGEEDRRAGRAKVWRPQCCRPRFLVLVSRRLGPTSSAAITTMFPLRLCGGKLLVAVTRERRYGPSRLRVNDDDDVLRPLMAGLGLSLGLAKIVLITSLLVYLSVAQRLQIIIFSRVPIQA